MIRTLLVDDQALFRAGIETLLSIAPDIQVVGQAGNGREAIDLARVQLPEVVLMDLEMPILDGVAATRGVLRERPSTRVLVLTTFSDDERIFAALRAGACGYLLKDCSAEQLVEAVRRAAAGESYLQPSVASKVLAEFSRLLTQSTPAISERELGLTESELEVLRLVSRGLSNKEIATAMGLAEGTVKNRVSRLLQKLGVDDRTQAAIRAREAGVA